MSSDKFDRGGEVMKKKSKLKKKVHVTQKKVCTLCEKHHKSKTQLCVSCNRKAIELTKVIPYVEKRASVNKLVWLKEKYKCDDIFEILQSNPSLYWDGSNRQVRHAYKRTLRKYHRSDEYKKENFEAWESEIPAYITNLMIKQPDKQLLTISGEKENPNIHYVCKVCGIEQAQKYSELNVGRGHNCAVNKSKGEMIIEEYLKKNHRIKVQYETLLCKNPITGRQLPYDIEITELKIIIEVHGNQHFEFIEFFHGSIENFYYQQRKDDYKKLFAEMHGYKVIYITYDDIYSGNYLKKLSF